MWYIHSMYMIMYGGIQCHINDDLKVKIMFEYLY